tara:strand:+ start:153 stop:377 length:225 start_codon:yes stop_codon:yes gene_type:complete
MITSIQLHKNIKKDLDVLKENSRESYEDVIVRLIIEFEKQKRLQTKQLIQSYKEMAGESLKITKEWSATEEDWN